MSIKANFSGVKNVQNATLRIERIWGSKAEGWHATVAVYSPGQNLIESLFQVSAKYVDGVNPFDILYSEVGKLPFVSNVVHDVHTTLNAVTIDTILKQAEAELFLDTATQTQSVEQIAEQVDAK